MDSGRKAVYTGDHLENFVKNSLLKLGYTQFNNCKKQILENINLIKGMQFITQMPVGETIYGTVRKCDFLIFNSEKFPNGLIIECKWQQSTGSVDEKYPYLIYNIVKTGIPTIILIDGGGYKKAALEWLKEMVNKNGTLKAVWTMNEFQKEINNGYF